MRAAGVSCCVLHRSVAVPFPITARRGWQRLDANGAEKRRSEGVCQSMQEMPWLKEHVVGGTLEGGVALVNSLGWNLTVSRSEDKQMWWVYAGEKPILKTDSREAVDALLYGMALSYSVLPEPLLAQIRREYAP